MNSSRAVIYFFKDLLELVVTLDDDYYLDDEKHWTIKEITLKPLKEGQ